MQGLVAAGVYGVLHGADVADDTVCRDVFGSDEAVQLVRIDHPAEAVVVDLGDDLAGAGAAREHAGDDVVLVAAGQSHEGVGAAYALLLQQVRVGAVAQEDFGLGHDLLDGLAVLLILLDDLDADARADEIGTEIERNSPAAEQHDVAHGALVGANALEKCTDGAGGADDMDYIPGLEHKVAAGDENVLTALNDGD